MNATCLCLFTLTGDIRQTFEHGGHKACFTQCPKAWVMGFGLNFDLYLQFERDFGMCIHHIPACCEHLSASLIESVYSPIPRVTFVVHASLPQPSLAAYTRVEAALMRPFTLALANYLLHAWAMLSCPPSHQGGLQELHKRLLHLQQLYVHIRLLVALRQ